MKSIVNVRDFKKRCGEMIRNFNHQKTIGIVGATPDAFEFILEANRLGFETYHLVRTEEERKTWFGADKQFVGTLDDISIHDDFLMKSDLLVYFDYSLSSDQIEEAQKTVVIPQGDDLLSIARDHVLQNAFKESLSVNIAPYETIVSEEDIKEGLRSIGYPAVLRTNYYDSENKKQSYFLYDESDIEEASKLLKFGTCVLESWIVTNYELSITLVKTAVDSLHLFPVVNKSYQNDRLSTVQSPVEMEQDIIDEIERVATLIAENIEFQGALTIDFIVSPAQALYVGSIHPFPNLYSRHLEGNEAMTVTEAQLRAITSMPLIEDFKDENEFVFVPFYASQKEIINELVLIYPSWNFTFYPVVKNRMQDNSEAIGHVVIQTWDMNKTLTLLKEKGF